MSVEGSWTLICSEGSSRSSYDLETDVELTIEDIGNSMYSITAPAGRRWGTQTAAFRGNVLDGTIDADHQFTITWCKRPNGSTVLSCSINAGTECFSDLPGPSQSGSWTADDKSPAD